MLRHKGRAALAHGLRCRLRQRLGVDVPLVGEVRLDDDAGAVAVRHHVHMRLDLGDQTERLHALDDQPARDKAVEAVHLQRLDQFRRHRVETVEEGVVVLQIKIGLAVEHVDERQVVAAADLEVVEVVRRRDLDRAGALLRIGIFIGDDRDATSDQREDRLLPHEMAIALVVRMHSNRGIAQHGLRPRGRDGDERITQTPDRILEVPEVALHLGLLYFEIGNGGEQLRVPIDQPLVLVDQPGAVERDEDADHRLREPFVHGEALARPVAGRAQPFELVDDGAARLRLPGPDLFQELLAPERAPARLLALHELALDHHLRGDAGVVGADLPEHVLAAHPLEPAEHVLEGVVERMPHMQRTRHIGWRDHDAIGLGGTPLGPAGAEGAGLLPQRIDALFHLGGLIGLVDHCRFGFGCSRGKKRATLWPVNLPHPSISCPSPRPTPSPTRPGRSCCWR